MNRNYDVYMCRCVTEQDFAALKIRNQIIKMNLLFMSGLAVGGDKLIVNRPSPYIKHSDISDDEVLKFRRPNRFAPVKP